MNILGKPEQIIVFQQNQLLSLPPTTPPLTSPFPILLSSGGTLDPLATIHLRLCRRSNPVLLSAVINWSATFTPPATAAVLNFAGYVDVTFEILVNGFVIYAVTQTAVQKGLPVNSAVLFSLAVPTFEIASLLHLDMRHIFKACSSRELVYTLRATNVSLVAPQVASGVATVSAEVGAVTFVAQEIRDRCASRSILSRDPHPY